LRRSRVIVLIAAGVIGLGAVTLAVRGEAGMWFTFTAMLGVLMMGWLTRSNRQ